MITHSEKPIEMKDLLFLLILFICCISCSDPNEFKAEKTIQGIAMIQDLENNLLLDTAKGVAVTINKLDNENKVSKSFQQIEPDGIFNYNYLNKSNYNLVFNYSKDGLLYKDSILIKDDEEDGKFHTVILKLLNPPDKTENSIKGRISYIDVIQDFQDTIVAIDTKISLFKGQDEFGELIQETTSTDGKFHFENLLQDDYFLTFNLTQYINDEIIIKYQAKKSIPKTELENNISIVFDQILLNWTANLTLLKIYSMDINNQIINNSDICLYSSSRVYDNRDSTCVGSSISGITNKMGWIIFETYGIDQLYYDGAFVFGKDTLKPIVEGKNLFSEILISNTLNIDTLFFD